MKPDKCLMEKSTWHVHYIHFSGGYGHRCGKGMLHARRCCYGGGYVGAVLVLVGHAGYILFPGDGGARVVGCALFVGYDLSISLSEFVS